MRGSQVKFINSQGLGKIWETTTKFIIDHLVLQKLPAATHQPQIF